MVKYGKISAFVGCMIISVLITFEHAKNGSENN